MEWWKKFFKDCWPELVLTALVSSLTVAGVQIWINMSYGCK